MKLVSIDCETHLIRPGLLAPPLVCVQWYDGSTRRLLNRDPGLAWFRTAIRDTSIHWLGHNIAFDFAVLVAAAPDVIPFVFRAYRENRVRDTKLRQQLIDIADGTLGLKRKDGTQGYSLADLEMHHCGRDRTSEKNDPDSWRFRYQQLEATHVDQWPEAARDYALADVDGAWDVFHAQPRNIGSEHEQSAAEWALHLISVHGVTVDLDAVARLKESLLIEQQKNQTRLIMAGLYKPGGTSKRVASWTWSKDMAKIRAAVERYYARREEQPPMTDSGKVATDKDALSQSGSRVLELLADGGGVDKLLTTYIPAMEQGAKGPINVRFNTLVRSGRTSSYGQRNDDGEVLGFNIQNLPTGRRVGGIRECIVPRPGNYLTTVDYSTLELRALAQVNLELFGHSEMALALRAGLDLHLRFASEILGISYGDAKRRHDAGDPLLEQTRDAAKAAMFGLPGGLGVNTFVLYARRTYGVTLTKSQARRLKNQWLAAWPEMRLYFARVAQEVGEGYATITDPVTGYVRGGLSFTNACNHRFQHRAAMGMKSALFQVAYECYAEPHSSLFGSRPIAPVHDEILAEIPVDAAQIAPYRLAEIMRDQMSLVIPDIPIETSKPALMERWYKKAKYKVDGHKLVPWTPSLVR